MVPNPYSLEGKVIVITGASSGIGRTCAVRCAEAGALLILIARNRERLEETSALLPAGARYVIIEADLSLPDLPETGLKEAVTQLGKISGMVFAAGISTTLPLRLVDSAKLEEFYKTNISGAVLLTRWISRPANYDASGCSIVWLASVMGLVGESGKVVYSITKGALIAGAKALAIELAPKKIRVNTIAPGVVTTPMTQKAFYNQTDEGQEKIKALHPLGLGEPDDVAYPAVFLLSEAARWITGTNLTIDGGYTAR